ncbi:MAG: DUF3822 family protein [Bacteroides sp.]|nr:DUF3822 family protein [Bacteroides sp.]
MLDKDLIHQPQLWTMGLLIGKKNIEAVFFPPVDTDDIIYRRIPLDPVAPSPLKAVEDAIYDNPLLLNTYRSIFAEMDTDNFILLPDELGDTLAARAIGLATGNTGASDNVVLQSSATDNINLFFEAGAPLVGFLRRTFFNITLTHPLAPLVAWCTERKIPEGELTACLRDNRLDLVATKGSQLLLANTFTFEAIADAAYYTLAVRLMLPFSTSARIVTSGEPAIRSEFDRILASASPSLPAPVQHVLPHRLLQGGSAVTSAPLPLILKSLQ